MPKANLAEEKDELMAFATPTEIFGKRLSSYNPLNQGKMPNQPPNRRPIGPNNTGGKPFPDAFPLTPSNSNTQFMDNETKAKYKSYIQPPAGQQNQFNPYSKPQIPQDGRRLSSGPIMGAGQNLMVTPNMHMRRKSAEILSTFSQQPVSNGNQRPLSMLPPSNSKFDFNGSPLPSPDQIPQVPANFTSVQMNTNERPISMIPASQPQQPKYFDPRIANNHSRRSSVELLKQQQPITNPGTPVSGSISPNYTPGSLDPKRGSRRPLQHNSSDFDDTIDITPLSISKRNDLQNANNSSEVINDLAGSEEFDNSNIVNVTILPTDDPVTIDQKLRLVFDNVCDSTHTHLDAYRLQLAFRRVNNLNFELSATKVITKCFDKNNSGGLDYKEFYQTWSFISKWRKIFLNLTSQTNSNSLSINQFNAALQQIGYRLNERTVNHMFYIFASSDNEIGSTQKSLTHSAYIESLLWLMKSTTSFKRFDNQRIGVGVFPFDNYVEEILNFRF